VWITPAASGAFEPVMNGQPNDRIIRKKKEKRRRKRTGARGEGER